MIYLIPQFKGRQVSEQLFFKLTELMTDEDSFVRVEAIESFKIYEHIPSEFIVEHFEPILMDFYENPEDEHLQQLSNSCGRIHLAIKESGS